MTYLSIGQVSKKFNVSLRTLRYYDEIGLLQPEKTVSNGKRYYSSENLLTLEKITLLKSASLSLGNIQNILSNAEISTILALHKELLKKELLQIQQSVSHTNSLLNLIKIEGELNWEQLLPLVEQNKNYIGERKQIIQRYFNEEEKQVLLNNLPKLEGDDINSKKWIHLMKRIYLCFENGLPPDTEEARILAADIQLLTDETFNGDQELANKFWEVRKSEELSKSFNLYPIKKEILDYVEEIMNVYTEVNL